MSNNAIDLESINFNDSGEDVTVSDELDNFERVDVRCKTECEGSY